MPLTVNDSSTWVTSTLNTPEGAIPYWVLADWDTYFEQYEDVNSLTRVAIAVAWDDAITFKEYALGFAERINPVLTYFNRHTPLAVPWITGQYLTSLKKIAVHAGTEANGTVAFHEASAAFNNWPTFPPTSGMPPRIVYEALFTCPNYDIISQSAFEGSGDKREIKRFVTRSRQVTPRERKVPSFGFETDEGDPQPISEVGFVPYYEYELALTWRKVPLEFVPDTAIANCLLKVNESPFDYKADGTYGKYQTGDILFKGLSTRIEPYRGPNGEWLTDLPYLFSYQPADGTGDGQLKVPRNNGTWIKIRERDSEADPKYLYQKADLDKLFQPERP